MRYKTKSISLNSLTVTPMGIIKSKCDSCGSMDCTNQIEMQTVSIFGINEKLRCIISGGEPMLVVDCEGFSEQ